MCTHHKFNAWHTMIEASEWRLQHKWLRAMNLSNLHIDELFVRHYKHVICGPTISQSLGFRQGHIRLIKKRFILCKRWDMTSIGATNRCPYMTKKDWEIFWFWDSNINRYMIWIVWVLNPLWQANTLRWSIHKLVHSKYLNSSKCLKLVQLP